MKHIKTTIVALVSMLLASVVSAAPCNTNTGGTLDCSNGQSGSHSVYATGSVGVAIFTSYGAWGSVSGPNGYYLEASDGVTEMYSGLSSGYWTLNADSGINGGVAVVVYW